jgi:hypothetical protein
MQMQGVVSRKMGLLVLSNWRRLSVIKEGFYFVTLNFSLIEREFCDFSVNSRFLSVIERYRVTCIGTKKPVTLSLSGVS